MRDPLRERTSADQDRELIELLNELRVALPGVQVLFAFLLIVPFSRGWAHVTDFQKNVYYAAFLCAALSSLFLIAPSVQHRLLFRQGQKEHLLRAANRLAITGTVFLAAGISAVVLLITDVVFSAGWAAVAAALFAGGLVWFWYGLPLLRLRR